MAKRIVKKHELQFLKHELQYLEDTEVLPPGKSKEIQDLYEVEKRFSFTKTLLYVGSILIGAGILSFMASNWDEISKLFKFIIIIGLLVSSNLVGYRLEKSYPKTSKSFYYLGGIVFGAGIFLVGQMFHFGGDFQHAFLWWSLGILPLAWVLRDKWILMAAAIFVLIYLTDGTYMNGEGIPFWILLWIVAIYVLNDIIGYSKVTGFLVGLLMLEFIWTILNYLLAGVQDSGYIYGLVYMAIGISLIFFKGKIREVDIFLGHLVHCGAAIALSFSEAWPIDWMYIPVSIIYLLFVLYLIKKGSLLNIIILCVMIFRFYIDISFDFLPKSFVFIIGGVILLGFGFYFEKQRKKGGGLYE
ncbi:DUF2157 domain-containing protein [Bacillus sp. 1NLA3E]|uniref:DUF2157 domain-containing protein n=1 Tax=Bacillus sp. 1NLA3E TaxID=666686 RepID=UPI000247EC1F|nr:DUF2157 domain-containing protein [Bacillus sp. 1NLA3E]AGK52354.1 hypothetical protein B1NLA3E_02870 [Bacillus sp. 1NLA3E]